MKERVRDNMSKKQREAFKKIDNKKSNKGNNKKG